MWPDRITGNYVLAEPHLFKVKGHQFKVPYGFTWDGASIPKIFHRVVTPYNGKVMIAALEHDYLCVTKPWNVSSKQAAEHFKRQLTVNRFLREVMYRAVLYFGPKWP
jgi:hypothetical protein